MPFETECHQCGEYQGEYVGKHWAKSKKCEYPDLTPIQEEIVTGLLMGDGSIWPATASANHRIQAKMVNEEYLRHLHKEFGNLSCGVSLYRTAEENAKASRRSGFNSEARAENYSDMYGWHTRTVPDISRFRGWYSEDGKHFPEGISLSPLVLKHWYCCDGSYNNNASRDYIKISAHNERERRDRINEYFDSVGLPSPRWRSVKSNCRLTWTVRESKQIFEYMGKPLPGFDYKWPNYSG